MDLSKILNFKSKKNELLPLKEKVFEVYGAVCAHRDIKVKVFNVMRSLEKCPNPKIKFHILDGDALISRSRGRVATSFIQKSNADMLFFLDDDVIIDTLDFTRMCWTMKKNNLDILGAAYPIKDDQDPCFAIRALEDGDLSFGSGGGLSEVYAVSTGCMLINRKVIQEMINQENMPLCNPESMNFYPLFETEKRKLDGNWVFLSEDWAFCARAKDLGFKVWVDTTIKLGHVGPKIYDWDDFLRPKKEVNDSFIYQVKTIKK